MNDNSWQPIAGATVENVYDDHHSFMNDRILFSTDGYPPPQNNDINIMVQGSWSSFLDILASSRLLSLETSPYDDDNDDGLSLAQQRALAIVPKIVSTLSIQCSCFITYEVVQDWRQTGRSTAVKRALLGMSFIDIMASSAWFLSTWAVPASSGFAYAVGNIMTCNFQGFLLQLAIGAPLYNCSLALFYSLTIKYRWTTAQFVKSKLEWWVHGFILTFAWGTSFLLLELEQYNHIQAVCWIIGSPAMCGNSSFQANPDVPCDRGNWAWAWGLGLFYGPLWLCVIGCTFSMAVLYQEVRKTHARSMRYSIAIQGLRHSTNRSGADTSRVAVQAILYSLSFLITWMPSTLWSIAHWFNWSHYGLDMFAACAEPLQGFWNLLVFLRGRPRTVRKIRRFAASILPCVLIAPPDESETFDDSIGQNSVNRRTDSVGSIASRKHLSNGPSRIITSVEPSSADSHADSVRRYDESALLSPISSKEGSHASDTPSESAPTLYPGAASVPLPFFKSNDLSPSGSQPVQSALDSTALSGAITDSDEMRQTTNNYTNLEDPMRQSVARQQQ